MTIKIYEENGSHPIDIWEGYTFVPKVGDYVSTPVSGFKKVVYRVFKKDEVHIIIK